MSQIDDPKNKGRLLFIALIESYIEMKRIREKQNKIIDQIKKELEKEAECQKS
ncbi:MAG: hypothetical protein PHX50_15110 [Massilibacteroides sp.]|nr:hypothetical protein [Massilibacteroides sp.]